MSDFKYEYNELIDAIVELHKMSGVDLLEYQKQTNTPSHKQCKLESLVRHALNIKQEQRKKFYNSIKDKLTQEELDFMGYRLE